MTEYGTTLGHIVLYASILISVLVLGIIRIELNSGLYSFQVSILVPLLSFANLDDNLQAGFAFWGLGVLGSSLLIKKPRLILVRFAASMFAGAVFIGGYVLFRQWELAPMLSVWLTMLLAFVATILLYIAVTFSVDPDTGKRGPTLKLRLSQLILVLILNSALALLGVWVQEGFGILAIAETGSGGRSAIFLLLIALLIYTTYTRNDRRLTLRRFAGISNAALALPWGGDAESSQQQLKRITARAIPNSIVRIQADAPGFGEVGTVLQIPGVGERYLVVGRKPGGSPFTALEQQLVEALAHMGTETMRSQSENIVLTHEANTDSLTGLANYRALREAINAAEAEGDLSLALLFIDVDNFKVVNDEHGHNVGNEVLRALAGRIRSIIRPTDLAARIGGDEFVVLLHNITNQDEIDEVVQRIHDATSRAIGVGENLLIHLTVSVGTSRPQSTLDLNVMLSESDDRMYSIKRSREQRIGHDRSRVHELTTTFGTDLERIVLEAVSEEQIRIALQPIVALGPNQIIGVEALVRYRHDQVGSIPASILINVAQQLGILDQLTEQVLERSFIEFSELQAALPELSVLHVNFEVEQMLNEDIYGLILEYNSKYPDIVFNIELTENSLNQASPRVMERLAAIRSECVQVSIDDFGKSYSSLRALVHYPIDIVKIDKSFADDLLVEEDRSSLIIRALVELSEALNYQITVEGVEEQTQLHILKKLGVEYAQGYFFGKPMSLEQFKERVALHGAIGHIEVDPLDGAAAFL